MAYIYFSIVKRKGVAPSNLPSVLVHILNRKELQNEPEDDDQRNDSHVFLQKTYILKTVFCLLPATYPLGKVLRFIFLYLFLLRVK